MWDNIPELIKNATSVECFKIMFLKDVRKDVYDVMQARIFFTGTAT